MKKYILSLSIILIFLNANCVDEQEQYIAIENKSNKIIIMQYAFDSPISSVPGCMKQQTNFEYQSMLYNNSINPDSKKNIKLGLGEYLKKHPNDTLFLGIFILDDINSMSCEEFEQKFPLKKEWKVTKADMEACNWNLVYP